MHAEMVVVHLTSSTFFGGPERQMLELARTLPAKYRSVFLSFGEGGRCQAFLGELRRHGLEAHSLKYDTPWLRAAVRELACRLQSLEASILCCHGYKADLLGRLAARRTGIPVAAVSRGWTGENAKVRFYEALDWIGLRWMDRVVCVSEGQAIKVRRAGVPADRVTVIRNAIRAGRYDKPDPAYRERLAQLFSEKPGRVVCAAGRLSPEKGFSVLVEAAARVCQADRSIGFVLFGDGPLRAMLAQQIERAGLAERFLLIGFREDLADFLPFVDLLVLPSYTEGLPNVVLEAFAASVPVVATAVGGTPELVEHAVSGYLVPSGDAAALADRIRAIFACEVRRQQMGARGRRRVLEDFTFEAQSVQYQSLFESLTSSLKAANGSGNRDRAQEALAPIP